MTFVPMLCPFCFEPTRGDTPTCDSCGVELPVTQWSKTEQRAEDMEAAGLCAVCERPETICDADPCIEEIDPLPIAAGAAESTTT